MNTLQPKNDFDINYHNSQEAGSNNYGFYVLHNVDVYIETEFGTALYQTAQSHWNNDYSCPSPKLGVSEDGGCDENIVKIDCLYESDFDDDNQDIEDLCVDLSVTKKELHSFYLKLMDLNNDAQSFFEEHLQSNDISDDLEDYTTDENTNYLIQKKS